MTTTVCDLLNKKLVADKRWSCGANNDLTLSDGKTYFIYCDDTGFEKMAKVGDSAIILAGDGPLIAEWKRWWIGDADPHKRPANDIDGINVVNLAIIDCRNNDILFTAGHKHVLFCMDSQKIKAFASGSGGIHAASYLQMDGDCGRSVQFAAEVDICTSTDFNQICYETNVDDLSKPITEYSVIVNGLLQKGKIMEMLNVKPLDKGVDLNKHPLTQEIQGMFQTGAAVASAPVPGMTSFNWDESVEQDFTVAMKKVQELR